MILSMREPEHWALESYDARTRGCASLKDPKPIAPPISPQGQSKEGRELDAMLREHAEKLREGRMVVTSGKGGAPPWHPLLVRNVGGVSSPVTIRSGRS